MKVRRLINDYSDVVNKWIGYKNKNDYGWNMYMVMEQHLDNLFVRDLHNTNLKDYSENILNHIERC